MTTEAKTEVERVTTEATHSVREDFEHFLSYSGLHTECPDSQAKLFRAFEAAWESPDATEVERLKGELAEAKTKLDFLKSKGLTVGTMQESGKKPYLTYVIEHGSELDDTDRINRSIDVEAEITALRTEAARLKGEGEELRADCERLKALVAGMGQGEIDARCEAGEELPMIDGKQPVVVFGQSGDWMVRSGAKFQLNRDGKWRTGHSDAPYIYEPTRESAIAFVRECAAREAQQQVDFRQRMALCPNCGNKRCPRATDAQAECSGSNEPGQQPAPPPFPETTVRCWRDCEGDYWCFTAEWDSVLIRPEYKRVSSTDCRMSNFASTTPPYAATELPTHEAYAALLTVWPKGAARLLALCVENPKKAEENPCQR